MTTLDTSGLHQTIVMTHQQVALDLLQSVEHHADHDQQRRTSVEVGERLLDAQELHRQRGQDRHDGQEERAGERDTRHDGVDVVHGLLTRFHTRDKAAVSLHVIGHHLGVDDNRGVEVGERDYQHCKREVVPETGHRAESSCEGRTGEQRRDKHQSLREDDGHHIRSIHLQGKRQANVQHDADNPMPMPIPEGAFAEEERYMINGVLTLASRSLRGIMTPRGEISWVDANLGVDEIREQLLSSPHSLFPVCRGELDEIIGIVRAKELLVALEEGVDVAAIASASPAIIVPETLDPINLLGVLRRARGSFVIVTNEFGVVQGLVTPLDVLEAIAGEFPDADETPEIITDGDGWLVKGGTDLHALQQALDVEHLADDDDIATVAGLVISANGHIPRVGDVIDVGPLHITIIEANDYRVDLVRIVKEQPAHDEDE